MFLMLIMIPIHMAQHHNLLCSWDQCFGKQPTGHWHKSPRQQDCRLFHEKKAALFCKSRSLKSMRFLCDQQQDFPSPAATHIKWHGAGLNLNRIC